MAPIPKETNTNNFLQQKKDLKRSQKLKTSKIIIGCYCKYRKELIDIAKKWEVPVSIMEIQLNSNKYQLVEKEITYDDENEINSLLQCNRILFEFFFPLGKTTNTYGAMCQLQKQNSEWMAEYANTYRPHYAKNIENLID